MQILFWYDIIIPEMEIHSKNMQPHPNTHFNATEGTTEVEDYSDEQKAPGSQAVGTG